MRFFCWLFLLLLMFTGVGARNIYTGKPEVERPDMLFFGGAVVAPMRYATPIGQDLVGAGRIVSRLYLGINVSQMSGKTTNHYGFSEPNVDNYYIDITSMGLNLSWMLLSSGKTQLAVTALGSLQSVSLGNNSYFVSAGTYDPFTPRLTFHYTQEWNAYLSFRPGVFVTTGKVGLMASYNFLYGDSRFGQKEDFEGLQIGVLLRIKKKARRY